MALGSLGLNGREQPQASRHGETRLHSSIMICAAVLASSGFWVWPGTVVEFPGGDGDGSGGTASASTTAWADSPLMLLQNEVGS